MTKAKMKDSDKKTITTIHDLAVGISLETCVDDFYICYDGLRLLWKKWSKFFIQENSS